MDMLLTGLRAPLSFNPWMAPVAFPTAAPSVSPMMPNLVGLETMLLAQMVTVLTQLMSSTGQLSPPSGSTETSGASGNSAGGTAVDPSQFQGGTETGRRLAAAALKESTDGDSPGGYCARDVGEALRSIGMGVARGDAWTKAEVLAKDSRFQEIKVAPQEIDRLPPGAIIVWDKGPGLPYGHISIALGDGREASDKLRKQMHLKTSYRVFMPR